MKNASCAFYLFLFLSLFRLSLSHGALVIPGNDKGNGGDILVCLDDQQKIKSVEFFDFAEATALRGWEFSDQDTRLTAVEHADRALDQLVTIDANRAKNYKKQVDNFYQEAQFIANANFRDIDDSEHVFIPKNCRMEQLIHQQQPEFPGDKRYVINLDWWNQLSTFSQGGAILHEILYRELDSENSKNLRTFNAMVFAKMFSAMTLQSIVAIYKAVGFSWWSYSGIHLDLKKPILWYDQNFVQIAKPFPQYGDDNSPFILFGQKISVSGNEVYFYPNGQIQSLYFNATVLMPSPYGEIRISCRDAYNLEFYPSGKVKKVYVNEPLTLNSGTFSVNLGRRQGGGAHIGTSLEFYESGALRWVGTGHGKVYDGKKWLDIENVYGGILFDERGFFIRETPGDNDHYP